MQANHIEGDRQGRQTPMCTTPPQTEGTRVFPVPRGYPVRHVLSLLNKTSKADRNSLATLKWWTFMFQWISGT